MILFTLSTLASCLSTTSGNLFGCHTVRDGRDHILWGGAEHYWVLLFFFLKGFLERNEEIFFLSFFFFNFSVISKIRKSHRSTVDGVVAKRSWCSKIAKKAKR